MELVTGGAGFIGSYLVKALLKKRKKIRVLDRKTSDQKKINELKSKGAEIIFGDLNDPKSLEKATKNVSTVYHLAAYIGGAQPDARLLENVNVIGTKNLLTACAKNKVKNFIYFSSVAVFGECKNANENTPCKPTTLYGKSKYEAEEIIDYFFKKYKINFVIFRPTRVYGPGETRTMYDLLKAIKKNKFFIIGKGGNLFNLIYIDDLISAVTKAADIAKKTKKPSKKIYIISNDKPSTMKEFSYMASTILNVKKPKSIPIFLANTIALPFEIISKFTKTKPLLTRSRVKTLISDRSFDVIKIKKELNWKPKVSLEEGVKKTVSWYRENNLL